MITIDHLTKAYGSTVAVDDVSFTAAAGRVTGFLGPNGAGKSTTMRIVVGLTPATSGTATVNGRRFVDLPNPGLEVGVLLDASAQHAGRTGRETLTIAAQLMGLRPERVQEMLELVSLTPTEASRRVRDYSLGMRQRLGIAAALIGDPQVLILDEPANGLDPEGIRWLRGFLRHLSAEGKTILVSSHMLQEVEQTVDDVVIISNGKLVKQGPMSDLHGESRTLVRSTDLDALAGALRVADVTTQVEDGALLAATGDLRLIGDVALRAGLPVYELRKAGTDLEALFFELTEGTNRNLGAAAGQAPAEQDAVAGRDGGNE